MCVCVFNQPGGSVSYYLLVGLVLGNNELTGTNPPPDQISQLTQLKLLLKFGGGGRRRCSSRERRSYLSNQQPFALFGLVTTLIEFHWVQG